MCSSLCFVSEADLRGELVVLCMCDCASECDDLTFGAMVEESTEDIDWESFYEREGL